ncbi:MAG: hypothetical protein V8S22_10580 [Lachnospiraceae bacterium]
MEEKEKVRLERVVDGGFAELLGMILYMKGMTHLGIGENKEAAQTIELLEDVVKKTGNPPELLLCLVQMKGQMAACRGNLEESLTFLERHKKMLEEFYGKNHINYLAACGELGTAYNPGGKPEKGAGEPASNEKRTAERAYDQGNTLSLTDNNIGVTYLDDGQPGEAALYLKESYLAGRRKKAGRDRLCGACLEFGAGIPDAGRNGKGKEISENSFAGISESLCTGASPTPSSRKRNEEPNGK